jgi:hypothetical protein
MLVQRPTPRALPAVAEEEILVRHWTIVALLALVPACAGPVSAMGFRSPYTPTLREQFTEAKVVIDGTLANPRMVETETNDTVPVTDLHIKHVLKADPILGKAKVVQINHFVPIDPKNARMLIFCDVEKGKLDAYFGIPVSSPAMIDYFQEAVAINPTDRTAILAHALRYLQHTDPGIAADAFKEFDHDADSKTGPDYRALAGHLSADQIAGWLRDPKTPAHKQELYARLLGHCGGAEHARLLREMLGKSFGDKPLNGSEGLLVGYTLLQPQKGWAYIDALLGDSSRPFSQRYAALRASRFFWRIRPDVVNRQSLLEGISRLLLQSDIADLAIDDLRKWGQWQLVGQVLALKNEPSHNIPIIRRAILCFALRCPRDPAAAAYVAQMRQEAPATVQVALEWLLRWEDV